MSTHVIEPARRIALLLALLLAGACTRPPEPLVEPPALRYAHVSPDAKAQAIRLALLDRGWSIHREEPGVIVARLDKRAHVLLVLISYQDEIRMQYRDSSNLEYELRNGQPYIHPQYEHWTRNLMSAIAKQLARFQTPAYSPAQYPPPAAALDSSVPPPPPPQVPPPAPTASEPLPTLPPPSAAEAAPQTK